MFNAQIQHQMIIVSRSTQGKQKSLSRALKQARVEALGHVFIKIMPGEQVSGIQLTNKNMSCGSVILENMSGSSVNIPCIINLK
jgi:hypothetical protein